ncbi:MAG TPA: flagellin [Planctomycetota bacterium]|nr:flagellin [Planctomycetota bacterium]
MGLRINTNVASLSAQRNLSKASSALFRNFEHLSTGRRIARASDDAAGLAISTRLNAQVRSLNQAARNANDGISLVQTAEGSLDEVSNVLVRARELAVQAGNETLSGNDRDALQAEFSALIQQVDQIASSTNFNGINLLNTSGNVVTLQIGAGTTTGTDTIDVTLASVLSSDIGIDTLDIGSTGDHNAAIDAIDAALDTVSSQRSDLGAVQNTLTGTISAVENRVENLSAAHSRIIDVDVASETAELTKNNILQQAALAVLAQANQQPQSALSLLRG